MWPLRRKASLVAPAATVRHRRIRPGEAEAFRRLGTHLEHFFPHAIRHVARPGPRGLELAEVTHAGKPGRASQLLLFAAGAESLDRETFSEQDCDWPAQALGLPGFVAGVNLVARGAELLTTLRHATPAVERRLPGWDRMLLNALLDHAVRGRFTRIVLPSAAGVREAWNGFGAAPERIERIYDAGVRDAFRARREDGLWIVDVRQNRNRRVPTRRARERIVDERTICIDHDTERDLGHRGLDPAFEERAAALSSGHLTRMLEVEARAGVRSTYSVVGRILPEVRKEIEAGGHELAFHSFDHLPGEQLARCRRADARIRGYRAPRSRLTPELDDAPLAALDFDWLASSGGSLGTRRPARGPAVVRLPIHADDFPLHEGGASPAEWESGLLAGVRRRRFSAFGLHDCYAQHWLPGYAALLEKLADLGTLRTLGEAADRVLLGAPA